MDRGRKKQYTLTCLVETLYLRRSYKQRVFGIPGKRFLI